MSVKIVDSCVMVAVMLLGLCCVSMTTAADPVLPAIGIDSDTDRIARLENDILALQAQVSQTGYNDYGDCGDCGGGGCGCGDWGEMAMQPGWNAGFEFVWMRPHFTGQSAYYTDVLQPTNTFRSNEFATQSEITPRIYLGHTWESGIGWRISWWQYNHFTGAATGTASATERLFARVESTPFVALIGTAANPNQTLTASHAMQLDTIDLDVSQDFNWCMSTVTVIGGLRYAKSEQQYNAIVRDLGVQQDEIDFWHSFEGVGPTFGIGLKRRIYDDRLSFFLETRGSILFGRAKQDISEIRTGRGDGEFSSNREARTIADARIGLEYARTLPCGNDFLLRLAYEGQMWFEGGGPTNDSEDLGMEGISFAMGLTR